MAKERLTEDEEQRIAALQEKAPGCRGEPGEPTRKQWFWCIHCERAFQSDVPVSWRRGWYLDEVGVPHVDKQGREWYECPYDGCDGSPIDFIPWDDIREDDQSFPVTPVKGTIYTPKYEGMDDVTIEL